MNTYRFTYILIFLFFLTVFCFATNDPKYIGIEIASKWGASWRFPVNSIDNSNNTTFKGHITSLKDGDVLIVGTHSTPRIFGSGNDKIPWADFWKHFNVTNPPKLGAVIIAGCTIDITDEELENIRRSFGAGVAFTPRSSYGLPHIMSTETIIQRLQSGMSLEKIAQTVERTHYVAYDPSIKPYWNLRQANTKRSYVTSVEDSNRESQNNTRVRSGVVIYINKFGNAGRIHIGSWKSYIANKKYRNEWLAGMSEEFLDKDILFDGQQFESKKQASDHICGKITEKHYRKILGWGMVPMGKYKSKTYYIDGLGCKIPQPGR